MQHGEPAYFWTQQAETSLDLNSLTNVEGRQN
jgi:hypothetical protein